MIQSKLSLTNTAEIKNAERCSHIEQRLLRKMGQMQKKGSRVQKGMGHGQVEIGRITLTKEFLYKSHTRF